MGFAVETRETKTETNWFPGPGGAFSLADLKVAGNEVATREGGFGATLRFHLKSTFI
jgi:hypothetical protein